MDPEAPSRFVGETVVVLVVLALALLAGPAGAATAIEYGLIAG
jgi:hypothetical protein